jgi:hypothetical protein
MFEEVKEGSPVWEAAQTVRESLRKDVEPMVQTWEDLYKLIRDNASAAQTDPVIFIAMGAIALSTALVMALRDMPEEGDCKVILAKTFDYMVFRPDIIGIDFLVTSVATAKLSELVKVSETLLKHAQVAEDSEPPKTGRVLH